jgi:predicted metal-dependent hydrolase
MSDTTKSDQKAIPVRRVALEPSFEGVPRHFARDNDLITSHIIAALSAVFPDGEDFFVRSVQHYRDQITDPELQQEVRGFIGQEVTHGREHRTFNTHLDSVGYRTKVVERFNRKALEFRTRHAPPITSLAATAGLEHVTATLAELVMRSEQTQESFGHEAVKNLFLWHALEENEHKAVAFDVYRAVGGSERMRIFTMKMIRYGFVVGIGIQVLISLLRDRASYRPGALRNSWRYVKTQPFLSGEMWAQLKEYERRGFHPSDRPTGDLIELWRHRLFGDEGLMVDSLPHSASSAA